MTLFSSVQLWQCDQAFSHLTAFQFCTVTGLCHTLTALLFLCVGIKALVCCVVSCRTCFC